ncbi:helix-turn-helix transcriptional regulator [Streptomyces sp. NPDC095602]|uniref:helix-turn-helix transcriptional regulator n=1 Tax=Streptomyces sp. NPDC095602 TaxID=3155819 RepID=UPI003329378F
MGRRENPIGACSRSLFTLASWLRARREGAGLTYKELAALTIYSEDTLRRSASGKKVPKLGVVRSFAQACGASPDHAEQLWRRARLEQTYPGGLQAPSLHVDYIQNFRELHEALLALYHEGGRHSYRELSERAGGHGRLPRTSVSRFINLESPPSRGFVKSFARACGVSAASLEAWGKAWDRANSNRHSIVPNPGRHRNPSTNKRGNSGMGSVGGEYGRYRFTDCSGCFRVVNIPEGPLDAPHWCMDCSREKIPKSAWL